ncbi:MAG: ATP-binding protein [candidate division WOR-3 bacterium]
MPSASAHAQHRPTILLVDDEPDFTASLAATIESRGYHAIVVHTGAEALHLVSTEHPDVALVDLMLPDMTGLTLLSRLRRLSPATETLVLTGHATLGSAVNAMGLGAFAFIEKPCSSDRLFLALEQALAQRTSRAPALALADALIRSPLMVAVIETGNGRFLTTSPALAQVFGESASERSLSELQPDDPVHQAAVAGHLQELAETGRAATELPLLLGGNRVRWFELHSVSLLGQPDRALLLLLDCDARHRTASEGARARAGFQAIFDNLAAGIMVIDSLFVVQQANPAIAHALGTRPEALVGRRCHELLHHRATPCVHRGIVCPIAASLASGTTTRALHRHLDSDGHLRHVEVTAAPLYDDSGSTMSFVAMFTDLTELENAHEETRTHAARLAQLNRELTTRQRECEAQAEELAAANARLRELSLAKDEFVSTVSHELRTPLTALSESLNLIAERIRSQPDGDKTSLLEVAVRNCRRLAELIDDLLDFSRIEAGRMQTNLVRVDLSSLIREVCDTFAPAARKRGLNLEHSAPPGLFVRADEQHAHRILRNLVANALKFTQQGGVTVSADRVDNEVIISVADTGVGIPETDRERVFERFYQCSHIRENRPSGTGLGLALCHELVELNGGRIWFESTEGHGSTFHFALPAPPEESAQ